MEKNKNTKRIDFHTNDLVRILKIFDKLHMEIYSSRGVNVSNLRTN